MITQKLQDAINGQIAKEIWSANLYLSMAFYFDKEGFQGFANWMKKQSQEEMEHAYTMADYIIRRGGTAEVRQIDAVPGTWNTPLEVFEHVTTTSATFLSASTSCTTWQSKSTTRQLRISSGHSSASK